MCIFVGTVDKFLLCIALCGIKLNWLESMLCIDVLDSTSTHLKSQCCVAFYMTKKQVDLW